VLTKKETFWSMLKHLFSFAGIVLTRKKNFLLNASAASNVSYCSYGWTYVLHLAIAAQCL